MVILQTAGDAFLVAGVAILVLSPWMLVAFGRKMLISFTEFRRIGCLWRSYKILTLVSIGMVVTWAVNKWKINFGSAMPWMDVVRLIITILANQFFMHVVSADGLLQMAEADIDICKKINARQRSSTDVECQ